MDPGMVIMETFSIWYHTWIVPPSSQSNQKVRTIIKHLESTPIIRWTWLCLNSRHSTVFTITTRKTRSRGTPSLKYQSADYRTQINPPITGAIQDQPLRLQFVSNVEYGLGTLIYIDIIILKFWKLMVILGWMKSFICHSTTHEWMKGKDGYRALIEFKSSSDLFHRFSPG